MKLFYSPFHTFVHKVLVTAHECGHWDQLERIASCGRGQGRQGCHLSSSEADKDRFRRPDRVMRFVKGNLSDAILRYQ